MISVLKHAQGASLSRLVRYRCFGANKTLSACGQTNLVDILQRRRYASTFTVLLNTQPATSKTAPCGPPWKFHSNLRWARPDTHKKRASLSQQRHKSTEHGLAKSTSPSIWTTENLEIPVGGNGTVTLNINHPLQPSFAMSDTAIETSDILVYLPPGPAMLQELDRDAGENTLKEEVQEYEDVLDGLLPVDSPGKQWIPPVVIKVNYRLSGLGLGLNDTLSPDYRFPSPIHDVSVAFDWIFRNQNELLVDRGGRSSEITSQFIADDRNHRILVYGSHIGGSLALMLALTQPNAVHAVTVRDPIVDWAGLDEAADLSSMPAIPKRRSKESWEATQCATQQAAATLIDLRTKLFRNPSGFFDAFASPLMFLRAPGRDTPLWRTARPEVEEALQDENKVKEEMKKEGGIEIDKKETEELIHERGYGPYDDDWHTAKQDAVEDVGSLTTNDVLSQTSDTASMSEQVSKDFSDLRLADNDNIEPATEQRIDDSTGFQDVTHQRTDIATMLNNRSSSLTSQGNVSEPVGAAKAAQTRRRKVLRRWPPLGRPEDVDLPWTRIISQPPPPPPASSLSTDPNSPPRLVPDLSYILHPQAKEMADVMRRACFWGREKSLGEERVQLEVLAPAGEDAQQPQQQQQQQQSVVVQRAMEWFKQIREVEK